MLMWSLGQYIAGTENIMCLPDCCCCFLFLFLFLFYIMVLCFVVVGFLKEKAFNIKMLD